MIPIIWELFYSFVCVDCAKIGNWCNHKLLPEDFILTDWVDFEK